MISGPCTRLRNCDRVFCSSLYSMAASWFALMSLLNLRSSVPPLAVVQDTCDAHHATSNTEPPAPLLRASAAARAPACAWVRVRGCVRVHACVCVRASAAHMVELAPLGVELSLELSVLIPAHASVARPTAAPCVQQPTKAYAALCTIPQG
jgi:hypothetical protein